MDGIHFIQQNPYYDSRISSVDDQICALIKQRKDMTNDNPGIPPADVISGWAEKYGLYERLLSSIFTQLKNEDMYEPAVEPAGFRKYIHILKSVEKGDSLYSVLFIRQYANASVVNFNINWDASDAGKTDTTRPPRHTLWKLFIDDKYKCRMPSGGGSGGHLSYDFLVSPPLPDKLSGLHLVFKEYQPPFADSPAGLEIDIAL